MSTYRPPPSVLLVAALGALGACEDAIHPMAPTERANASVVSAAPTVGQSVVSQTAGVTEFGDLVERLLPSFDDQVIAGELHAQLDEFRNARAVGDLVAAHRAIARVEPLLARSGAHPANVGAIRLALSRAHDDAESALAASGESP